MSFHPQNKPIQSFGQLQDTFTFRFRSFQQGDQFTIVEDSPRHRVPRTTLKSGGKGSYSMCLVQINFNNTIADLEIYDYELSHLTALCPKGTQNFKGATFAFDGRRWQYICGDMPIPRDPRQPDLNPPQYAPPQPQHQDQKSMCIKQLVDKMKTAKEFGIVADESKMTAWADKISPGNCIELIKAAKDSGDIVESQGIFKVIE